MALSVQDPGLGTFTANFGQISRRKSLTAPKEAAAEAQKGQDWRQNGLFHGLKGLFHCHKSPARHRKRPSHPPEQSPGAPFPKPALPAMAWATPTR